MLPAKHIHFIKSLIPTKVNEYPNQATKKSNQIPCFSKIRYSAVGDGFRTNGGAGQMGPGQMGPGQMGPGQMGPGQMGPGQMGPGQMGPGQMGPGQMGPGQMGLKG